MEFLRVVKGRGIMSTLLHVLFNIALATMVFLLLYIAKQPEAALLLVLISKWRIFAVRMRYWKANILANLVDITVGCSVVGLLHLAGEVTGQTSLWLQLGITVLYAVWLIAIKPLSSKKAMAVQALISLFVGTWAVMAFAHVLSAVPFVMEVLLFAVGYGAARHMLSMYKEKQLSMLAMVFGLVVAEIGWVASHWTVGYGVRLADAFRLPQVAIIVVLVGLAFERFYSAVRTGQLLRQSEYSAPIIFSVATIVVLLMLFSSAASV